MTQQTAGRDGTTPGDLTIRRLPQREVEAIGFFEDIAQPAHGIEALSGGQSVGWLIWYGQGHATRQHGEIANVYVTQAMRRRGIATRLLAEARKIEPKVQHSEVLSGDGRAWSQRTAMPSWRDRGAQPTADAFIQPDVMGSRRLFAVYLYGQMEARFRRLDEAKAFVETIYGTLEWKRVKGDQDRHWDPTWGSTTEFNDAGVYYVVERLPRLAPSVALARTAAASAQATYDFENALRGRGVGKSWGDLEPFAAFLREVLVKERVPFGDEAYVWPAQHPTRSSFRGYSSEGIPRFYIGAMTRLDEMLALHEAAHCVLRQVQANSLDEAHDQRWADTYDRLIRQYGSSALQGAWAQRPTAAKTAAGPMLDLYHRTSPDAAAAIYRDRKMVSRENTGEAYFSTKRSGQAEGYGGAVVHIRVPESVAELDDEFPDGEQHYRVRVRDIRPEWFIVDSTTAALQAEAAFTGRIERIGPRKKDSKHVLDALDAQGGGHPMLRSVVSYPLHGNALVVAWQGDQVVGAIDYDTREGNILGVKSGVEGQGVGTALMAEIARHLLERGKREMKVIGMVDSAKSWYVQMGCYTRPGIGVGTWTEKQMRALATGRPTPGHGNANWNGREQAYVDNATGARVSSLQVRAEADTEDGVMVCLVPPLDLSDQLLTAKPMPEGREPLDEQHVTLVYLGKAADVDVETLHETVEAWAEVSAPITGWVTGYGTFENPGENVLYAAWDFDGGAGWRQGLVDALGEVDIVSPSEFDWTPHQTMAYTDEPVTEKPHGPMTPDVTFSSVHVVVGPIWKEYPLLG